MERRNTIQKALILRAVCELKRHLTADEVYEFVKKDHPSIGKGTVYRNLAILAEEGAIRKVEVPDGSGLWAGRCALCLAVAADLFSADRFGKGKADLSSDLRYGADVVWRADLSYYSGGF